MSATDQLKEKGAEALVKMIDVTIQSINDVVEFGKQQIPEIIHQLLMWKATEAGLYALLGIAFLIAAFLWGKKVNEWGKRDYNAYGAHIATACATIVGVLITFSNLMDFLYILVAPKVYLLEYSTQLIKK